MICGELQNPRFSRVFVEFSRYRSPQSIGRTLISTKGGAVIHLEMWRRPMGTDTLDDELFSLV